MSTFRAAVLTISDTSSRDPTTDKSGPAAEALLHGANIFAAITKNIISDDTEVIRKTVTDIADSSEPPILLVTTGGTGFGARDNTPEAIAPILDRVAPGIVHAMLSGSLSQTAMAALSRPIAGTRKGTLIITLPGSVRAVTENLVTLLKAGVLAHALDLMSGGSGAKLHLQLEDGFSHAANYQSEGSSDVSRAQHFTADGLLLTHDPALSVTKRRRQSPFPIITFDRAMEMIVSHVKPLKTEKRRVDYTLTGYVLAQDVVSAQNIPPALTTNVDGYAMKASDCPGKYRVVHSIPDQLPEHSVFRINTGGTLPPGSDSVVMVEDTLISVIQEDEEFEIETLTAVPLGANVRLLGSDVKAGDCVLHRGSVISSGGGELGTLSFIGCWQVNVIIKPKVAILSTGDELMDLQRNDGSGGIYDTNRPSLMALLRGLGYEVIDLGIAPDNVAAHVELMKEGFKQADLLLTTGGSSMGSSDLLKPVIERYLNGVIHFGRVALKPGKPTTFATVPFGDGRKHIIALPGNPVSAIVTFYLFVVPTLRLLGGWASNQIHLPRVIVQVSSDMRLDERPEYHRVIIYIVGGQLIAASTGGQRSSRVASLCGANGLLHLPSKSEMGATIIRKGSSVEATLIGELLNGQPKIDE